jgi:hypothetical protein
MNQRFPLRMFQTFSETLPLHRHAGIKIRRIDRCPYALKYL